MMRFPPFIITEFSSHNFDEAPIFGRKTNFGELANVPECGIFEYSDTPLELISTPANEAFDIIEVPIAAALALLGDEAYELHSERWYNVRKQFSTQNKTHYPWLYVNTEGDVCLMDGRHRLVAMMKLKGMQYACVQVEPSMREQVQSHFKQNG